MPVGKFIEEKGGHVEGFRDEISRAAQAGDDKFFGWFDGAMGKDEARSRGHWDFSIHIAAPLSGLIARPHEKVCLEIGYGGGRILAAAAKHFKHAIGVDVHRQSQLVQNYLASEGVHNATLYETDGMAFPVADNCVDLVYTFIVMQHMESVEVFASNIKEVARCLKPSGLAAIYFGRVSRLSLNKRNNMLFRLDNLLERTPFTPRFIEKKARVNETNLLISVRYAKRIFRDVGLQVIRQGGSRKRVPDGGHLYGSQTLFIVKK